MPPTRPIRDGRPLADVVAAEGVSRAIQLKHVASVLYTYRCSIACKHCLFACSPYQPDVHVSHDDGLEFLRQLHATDRVVHIAGGEAFIYWDDLLRLCRAAGAVGIVPHFVETNAKWCHSDAVTRERLEALKAAGVLGLLISADAYHLAFVPPANRERCYRIAVELFGAENVIAAALTLEQLEDMQAIGQNELRLAEVARAHPPMLVGRAGEALSQYVPRRPVEKLADDPLWHGTASGRGCSVELNAETMWEIHIDPYGNIQTCCGIIVGNARRTPLPELMVRGFQNNSDIVRRVHEQGPFGLLELAVEKGYRPEDGYAQKCHLCWEVRKFLRPSYPDVFGPAEIYEPVEA